ncbi:MAG: cobalamin-binding protein [Zetaproteobacteria bacterium]|nr:MAG: cobalamin-binding protein [Zetaproteobacteria bacterium]
MRFFCLVALLCLAMSVPAQAAERILALAPHICETLFAIGAGQEVVGAVDYCDYPPEAQKVPRVGNYLGVNAEAALRLAPTIVIAFNGADPGLKPLASQGVRIVVSKPRKLSEVIEDIRRIGVAVHHEQEATQLADALQAKLASLVAVVPQERMPAFYEIWHKPLIAPASDSFITDLLGLAGFRQVYAGYPGESVRASLEGVVHSHPEVVIIPDENRDLEERKRFWRKWLGKDIRIFGVPHDLVHRPGPRLVDALEELVRIRLELAHGR